MYYISYVFIEYLEQDHATTFIASTNSIDDLKNSIIYSIKDCVFSFFGQKMI